MKKWVPAAIALAFVLSIYFVYRNYRADRTPKLTDQSSTIEERINENFKFVEIPDDFNKAELKPKEGVEGFGVVAEKFEENKFEMTILANLVDPGDRQSYKAVLYKDNQEINLGNLYLGKGGYILNFNSNTDLSDYKVKILLKSDIVLEE